MQNQPNITRLVAWLAGAVIGVVVVLFPLGYFLVSYQYTSGSVETEAEINGRIISQIISANPRMWEYEQVRIEEYLARRSRKGHTEIRRVYNVDNRLVAESADELASPVMKRSVALFDSGVVVGRIEIVRSLRPLIILIALGALPLGAVVFLVLQAVPLRALRRSEEAVKKERDTAQKYLDVAGVMLLALDADQRVTLINKKGCEVLGYGEKDIIGRNWFDSFIPEKQRAEIIKVWTELAAGDAELLRYYVNVVLTADGGERLVAWNNTVLTDETGKFAGTLSSGEDITERKRLEDQLRQAQKMEAVGQLAGGVAHDFNNILQAVIGYGSLVHMKLAKEDPLRHPIEQILAASERAARLVRGLLAFSRKQIINPRPVEVNEVIRGVEKLLRRLIGEEIELRTSLAPGAVTVLADSGQLEQVLMNLATNARDAMPEGGVLSIETSRLEAGPGSFRPGSELGPGNYAVIAVSDTGTGMDDKTKGKIFDPFFTTKEVGRGTGLGLAIVYGVLKQHNGDVSVYSEPGKGTTFKLYFPAVANTVVEPEAVEPPLPTGGAETLLLAEDDETVRTITRSTLENFGYAVIEAVDGEDALRKYIARKDGIHLVILDVIMPKRNGKSAYDEMRKIRPDVKAIFTSGYAADIIQQKGISEDGNFLSKPVAPAELLRKVRETLDR